MDDLMTGTCEKQSDVVEEISRIDRAIGELAESISCLQDRLLPVSLNQDEKTKEQGPTTDKARCDIDRMISENTEKVKIQTVRIRRIIVRLQI